MTQRERQILQWIEADPMISQEALAERAGITRSSVAVHISNLMKKGYIAGKGYVLRSGTYAAVVGGVNVDIGGQSYAPLVARDSNPGRVRISLGGVGRNIAHNMSLLGVDVRLLTAFGDDLHAQRVAASCGELGIDISHALQVPGGTTSTYLFLNDVDGDMALGLSDMDICERITPAYLASNLSLLNNAQVIVADTNIPAESLQYLVTHCTPLCSSIPSPRRRRARFSPCSAGSTRSSRTALRPSFSPACRSRTKPACALRLPDCSRPVCTACSSPLARRACSPPTRRKC